MLMVVFEWMRIPKKKRALRNKTGRRVETAVVLWVNRFHTNTDKRLQGKAKSDSEPSEFLLIM